MPALGALSFCVFYPYKGSVTYYQVQVHVSLLPFIALSIHIHMSHVPWRKFARVVSGPISVRRQIGREEGCHKLSAVTGRGVGNDPARLHDDLSLGYSLYARNV